MISNIGSFKLLLVQYSTKGGFFRDFFKIAV